MSLGRNHSGWEAWKCVEVEKQVVKCLPFSRITFWTLNFRSCVLLKDYTYQNQQESTFLRERDNECSERQKSESRWEFGRIYVKAIRFFNLWEPNLKHSVYRIQKEYLFNFIMRQHIFSCISKYSFGNYP